MVRTYRISVASAAYMVAFSLFWFGAIFGFVIIGDIGREAWASRAGVAVALVALLFALLPAFATALLPYAVTLAEDGQCEFRSLLGRRSVRVQQIRSLEWDSEGDITIRHDRGKVRMVADPAFEDLLVRLFELNPAIEAEDGVRRMLGLSRD